MILFFQVPCAIDVRNFPFDNQTCEMRFGSWSHSLAEVDLDNPTKILHVFTYSSTFEVMIVPKSNKYITLRLYSSASVS